MSDQVWRKAITEQPGKRARRSVSGTNRRSGKDGLQVIRSTGARWTDQAEARFLDCLAATCNVTASAEAAGFTTFSIYRRRRGDPVFAQRWQAALEQGYARIEMALVRRAADALEGLSPDPATPIPAMTVEAALKILSRHRSSIEAGTRGKRNWVRPRSLDELRDSILAKLEAVAPGRERASAAGE